MQIKHTCVFYTVVVFHVAQIEIIKNNIYEKSLLLEKHTRLFTRT